MTVSGIQQSDSVIYRGRIDIRQATGRICHRAGSHFKVFYVVDNRFEKANYPY